MAKKCTKRRFGFTIIELLIVIVVIGILATIVIVSYSRVQAKSRDARRKADISMIQGYLELYASEHGGSYPLSSGAGHSINGAWSTTAEPASWAVLEAALAPYGKIPKDPISPLWQAGTSLSGIYSSNYAYYGGYSTSYCGGNLLYILTYQLETEANVAVGTCPATDITYSPGGATTYRKVLN